MNELPLVVADLPLPDAINAQLAGKVRLVDWEEALAGKARDAKALYTYRHPIVDDSLLDLLPALAVISNHGVGVDHIDLAAAARHGVPVGNTPGILENSVADLAMLLVLGAARRIVELERYARSEAFSWYDPSLFHGQELAGATLGILGMGGIGLRIAKRAAACEMKIIYHNRRPRAAADLASLPADTGFVSLEDLCRQSDYLVLSTPLTPETTGIIGAAQIALMKPTAVLVNVARGAVVDMAAMTDALAHGRLRGASLDVTDPEPLPRDHPLLSMHNVLITPHVGSATIGARAKMAQMSVENLLVGLQGKPLPWRVG